MGIWSRLGSVIKTYLSDAETDFSREGRWRDSRASGDPDLDAAFEELNDYLNRKDTKGGEAGKEWRSESARPTGAKPPPEELRNDFSELGVPFGADADECKASYKKLLKIHHPDRHAGHEGNLKKATDRMARINAAYDRIEKWRRIAGRPVGT